MAYRAESPEVYYADGDIKLVSDSDIAFLKARASENPRRRARLCMHRDPQAAVHEMLIVHHRETYVRPHRHHGKGESFHVIEGHATVVLFDDDGTVIERIPIGAGENARPFYYRFEGGVPHTLLIESEWLVFHETTKGPFERAHTEPMPWAPEESDPGAVRDYLRSLRESDRVDDKQKA